MRRFPFGLTLAVALAVMLLAGLGAWQLRRLEWKEALLAHVAALRTAPSRPIDAALADVARGADVDFIRVTARCGAAPPAPPMFRYAIDGEQVAWRPLAACAVTVPPFDGVLVDLGIASGLVGAMSPRPLGLPSLARVTGVLRRLPPWALGGGGAPEREGAVTVVRLADAAGLRRAARLSGLTRPAPVLLAAEREDPPIPRVIPRALPAEIPNNHLAYALTWFALAAILVWMYAGALLRRARSGAARRA